MKALPSDPLSARAPEASAKSERPNIMNAFSLKVDGNTAWLTFDMPGSSVNIFNESTFRDFNGHLSTLEADRSIKVLVIRSAKDRVFIAGADLKTIRALPADQVDVLLGAGQTAFNRLANLPMLKVR